MKKNIHLVIFSSALHDSASVMGSRKELFDGLRSFADLEIIYPSMLPARRPDLLAFLDGGNPAGGALPNGRDARTLCFIATGGTEEFFKGHYEVLPQPVLLLSDGLHNSLAAAFEIKTYLSQRGIASRLINAPLDYNPDFFRSLENSLFGEDGREWAPTGGDPLPPLPKPALKAFEKTTIGLIGGASGWLISSGIDREAVEKDYGVHFLDIPLRELETAFDAVSAEDPEAVALRYRMERFLTGDRTCDDLLLAARMYLAVKSLCTKYDLQALSLKCFGILTRCRTTACLAMALLNDEGIVAGCEGDIPSLWTMLYARYAYGLPAFMANPSSSNRRERTLDFAHCTIPLAMVHGYRLPSHFESQTGIGIAGSVPSGRYRLVKIYGERLDQFYETEGDLLMNTNIPQRCRTQIRFRFDSEEAFDRFFRVNKGNHIILCKAAE